MIGPGGLTVPQKEPPPTKGYWKKVPIESSVSASTYIKGGKVAYDYSKYQYNYWPADLFKLGTFKPMGAGIGDALGVAWDYAKKGAGLFKKGLGLAKKLGIPTGGAEQALGVFNKLGVLK